jgi:DNA-binding transcriptional MerR regulator
MNTPPLSIGAVAKRTGCSVPTIRYYEDIGLLPAAARTAAGQRSYGQADLGRLSFIRRCRDFGFSVEQVRELVELMGEPSRPCAEVRDIAAIHLAEVQRKLKEMAALEASLVAIVRSCDTACAGGAVVDCTILEGLAVPPGQPAAARCCG